MSRLLLLRHAQTTAGDHIFLGWRSDPGLSPKGRQQARDVAERLRTLPIAVVIISPMLRVRETAALAVPHRQCRVDNRLREIDYGVFSGLTVDEARRLYPDDLATWQGASIGPPGSEPLEAVAARVVRAALDLADKTEPDRDVLFISHNLPIRLLIAGARGKALTEWRRVRVGHGAIRAIRLTPLTLARWQAILDHLSPHGHSSTSTSSADMAIRDAKM